MIQKMMDREPAISAMLLAMMVFVAVNGCGSGGPFDYVAVSGKVLYEDGTPLPAGTRIVFVSQAPAVDGKFYPRPATAFIDENGYFSSVTSRHPGDGLVPGKHKVVISLEYENSEKDLPKEYTRESSTPLEVNTADAPWELKVRRP